MLNGPFKSLLGTCKRIFGIGVGEALDSGEAFDSARNAGNLSGPPWRWFPRLVGHGTILPGEMPWRPSAPRVRPGLACLGRFSFRSAGGPSADVNRCCAE